MNIFRCIFPFLFSYSDLCQDNKIPIQSNSISFMMYFISNIFDDYSTDFHQNSSILNPGNLIEYIQSSKMIKFLITLLMSCPITVFESIFIPIVIDISNNEQPKIFISHFIIKLLKRLEEKEKICIVLQYIGHLLITNCITTSHESILGYLFDKVEYFTDHELNLINKILIYIFIKSLKKPAQIIFTVIEQNISKFIRIIKIFPEDWGVCLSISKSYMKNHEFNHFISLINVLNPSFRIEINLHSILGKDENYDRMLINYFKLNELKQDYSRFQVYIFSTIDEYASTYSRYLHNH
ncbi:hypothetical protein TRFO_21518 [Tritrichomonas foetus]|uniref:Uncharacterized protein n=1 Tax=Tritrichomonas foetus TaxID=1144522 RepID=A0A1J4KF52_9EUKA|nr:hypothetical protein TRFO_21518 [Tritrichomonas foetus]|eukprot:OHT09560.1 hypothetical protein TRFO_21518 [Tritrichomonas foetus]